MVQSSYSILWDSKSGSQGIGGSRGGREGRTPPPGRPNSFDFMQFLGKFGVFTPPWRVHAPPRKNPGSATACPIKLAHSVAYIPAHLRLNQKLFLYIGFLRQSFSEQYLDGSVMIIK